MYELWGSGGSPFKKHNEDNILTDSGGTRVKLLGKSAEILHELTQPPYEKTIISWVSCTDEPSWAAECLSMFTTSSGVPLDSIAKHNQIFKANKREHFERLKKETGIEFSDMIFFDNQANNINDVSKLGVHSVLCPDGMLQEIWTQGIESFQSR